MSGKPTMDDVARHAGVSRALVSLVMRESEKVSERSRAAVLRAADELGYRPNLIARNLASKTTRTIGLLINDLHNPYFPGVADGIKQSADAHGYRLLINSAFLSDDDERTALESFIDFRVDGIILTGSRASAASIEQIAAWVPVIVVSRPVQSKLVDTINNDDRLGAELAVEHLIDLGHRHICHIDGGRGAGASQRRGGYESTMRAHGLEPFVVRGSFTETSGAQAAEQMLASDEPVTAVFAGNDVSALGALDAIEGAGLRVPDDISIVGYDNTFVAALRHVSLTSIDQSRTEQGALAVQALLERVEGGRTEATHQVLPPSLVARNSTGPPPAGS